MSSPSFNSLKQIAVLTSGGDAPGMNAAIRAVVRAGVEQGFKIWGVQHGYKGLIAGNFLPLGTRDVGHIIEQAGTILGSSRSSAFKTAEGVQRALESLKTHAVDALVVIGGDGSQKGAYSLSQKGFPVVGIASTIDNDLAGSEITIGVDTALNVSLEAIDRLKVTASSFGRVFLIEVMGRNCGYLALMAGIAGGAEAIVLPEQETSLEELADEIRAAYKRGKSHAILVVAEGARQNAEQLAAYFEERHSELGFELRVTKLGHVQRGGTPSAFDRLLATRLGAKAVECLVHQETGVLVGLNRGQITATPLATVVSQKKDLDLDLLKLARILAQ